MRAGAEKIITRNGESYVALVDVCRLDHYHRLEREHIHLAFLRLRGALAMKHRGDRRRAVDRDALELPARGIPGRIGGRHVTPAPFAKILDDVIAKWARIVKSSGAALN